MRNNDFVISNYNNVHNNNNNRFLSSQKRPDPLWEQPSLLFSGYSDLFPGVKLLGIDNSSPSVADIKNEWSYTSASPIFPNGVGSD